MTFWSWFIRPAAEFLGAVALVLVLVGIFRLLLIFSNYQEARKSLARKKAEAEAKSRGEGE